MTKINMENNNEIKSYLFELLDDKEKEILEVVSKEDDLDKIMKILIGYQEDSK